MNKNQNAIRTIKNTNIPDQNRGVSTMNKNQNAIRTIKNINIPGQNKGVSTMNKNQNAIRNLTPSFNTNSISPISIQYATQTNLNGTMNSAQIDQEQGIKVLSIFASAAVVLGGLFMICSAFGNKD